MEENKETCEVANGENVNESNDFNALTKQQKKKLTWQSILGIAIACVLVLAVAAWCIINIVKADDYNTVAGISVVVALLLGSFIVCFLGYLFGSISIKGISLGTAGVFLVAIAFGCLCTIKGLEKIPLLNKFYISGEGSDLYKYYGKIIQNVGLILFVASVGFIAGPRFFRNLKKNAKSYVLLGIVIICVGGLCAFGFSKLLLALGKCVGEEKEFAVGILSGALTTTPGYSAALGATEELGKSTAMVTLGQAIAYPFGVVGVVLFVQIVPKVLKADMNKERSLIVVASNEKIKQKSDLFVVEPFGIFSFGLAVVFGLLLGAIKIPLSSKGYSGTCFSLGTTGGVLIMSLIFGHFGHIGKISLEMPEKTSKAFREFGLMLFLIGAGVTGGAQLVNKVTEHGGIIILYGFIGGVIMTTLPMIIGFILAKKVLKICLFNTLGSITGGMTSTPALGTLINVAGTDDVANAYAATYPIALVAVVLICQFLIIL